MPGCAVQPAGENGRGREGPRLARQDDENRLGDFFRQGLVARLPQRNGIDEMDMARHQLGKGRLGLVLRVRLQQALIVFGHFINTIYAGRER